MRKRYKIGCLTPLLIVVALAVIVFAILFGQGRREPAGRPEYVALGSSFAAGAGLGTLQDGSPLLCARSINGYPPRLARQLRLSLVDMSCGGAVTAHLLNGGQFFQGPQIRTIGRSTSLVTITAGGNDVGYVGDLSMLAARNSDTVFGWGVRHLWSGPKTMAARDFPGLERTLVAVIAAVRERAPNARIVLATYPTILPPDGTCAVLNLSQPEASLMRAVGDRLAETTRGAARRAGALLVDMHALGRGHDACSAAPWTRGWTNGGVAPFHPTLLGAQATADAIARALARSPERVAAVDHDDAASHQAGSVAREEQHD